MTRAMRLWTVVFAWHMSACGEAVRVIGDANRGTQTGMLGAACHQDGTCDDGWACVESTCGVACTFGMDQTCNDLAVASALWGACNEDGTCRCNPGFAPSATTGRCSPTPETAVIGDACESDAECGAGFVCWHDRWGLAWLPEGYCLLGTAYGGPAMFTDAMPCPAGSIWSPIPILQAPGTCLDVCAAPADCREGYLCDVVELFPGEAGSPVSAAPVCWPPVPAPMPASMKGYELYSREVGAGRWFYTLITGTNRLKTCEEIVSTGGRDLTTDGWVRVTVLETESAEAWMDYLPLGSDVVWLAGPSWEAAPGESCGTSLPPAEVVAAVRSYCEARGINLGVVGG
ncbi:MAG: hypothetical protein HY903_15680 [Deltaproteobacteria bacterium]|nr:hypothetical protein [Deltaproteobacteria bacterium]